MIDFDLLEQRVEEGYVSKQKHIGADLWIYNYTPSCQYSRAWDEATLNARGLILSGDKEIVARPLKKFFNYGEVRPPYFVITKVPVVTTKMDGSLGILYPGPDGPAIATRGSFASDQALRATDILRRAYVGFEPPEDYTLVFEIIYPENRIVVDYKGMEDLVLLAVINKKDGSELEPWEWAQFGWPGPSVDVHYGLKNVEEAYTHGTALEGEGVVCAWYTPGIVPYRLKIKTPEYVRLHRIVTGTSTKTIWQWLMEERSFEDLLEAVPDEYYQWVREVSEDLTTKYHMIHNEVVAEYMEVLRHVLIELLDQVDLPNPDQRKRFAQAVKNSPNKGYLFLMLDRNFEKLREMIWKSLKPAHARAYTVSDDE